MGAWRKKKKERESGSRELSDSTVFSPPTTLFAQPGLLLPCDRKRTKTPRTHARPAMPKPGYFDGTEAQVVLEPSSFARELAASARAWADDANAKRGGAAASAALATAATAAAVATTATATAQPPPLAEARGRDPRSSLPGGWVRVRVVDSCTASGPEGGLRFCAEIAAGGEGEGAAGTRRERRRRLWLPLAWLHPSSPNPVLAIRPLPPTDGGADRGPEAWSPGDEAEVGKRGGGGGGGGGAGGGSWWPATVLRVEGGGSDAAADEGGGEREGGGDRGDGPRGGGGGAAAAALRTLVVRIEPCCCYPAGAVVSVPAAASSAPSSHAVRRRPPLPPLFEEEAARLQLEQERAERSGRLGGGFGSRGGVLGSGRRWGGMATSFGESVHPEEWRKRTAGLLLPPAEGEAGSGGGSGGGGEQETAAAAGPSAGVSSGARTHLIAGFSMEAALCPGQLSTAAAREEEEGEGEGGDEEKVAAAEGDGQPQQPKNKKRKTTTLLGSGTDRDPFGYDETARALLEAGGSL